MRGIRSFLSLVTVIILTIVGIYTVCVFNVSNFITEKNLNKTVGKIKLTEVLSEGGSITPSGNVESTMDKIYAMASTVEIPKEHIDAVINSKAVNELAANYLNKVAIYITTGEEKHITSSELSDIVRNNIDVISTETGLNLDATMKQNIVTGVETYADEIVLLVPSPRLAVDSIDQDQLKGIQELLSENTKTKLVFWLIGLTVLLIVLQFSIWKWLSWNSISVAITGAVSLLLGVCVTPVVDKLLVGANQASLLNLLHHFTDGIANNFYIIGGILLAIAFIEISIYVNVKHYKKQKEVNQAKNNLETQKED